MTRFTGHNVRPLGTLHLPLILIDARHDRRKIVTLVFMVVREPSEHNIILGRIVILQYGVIVSNIHGLMKFPTNRGITMIIAEVPKRLECNKILKPEEITRRQSAQEKRNPKKKK